MTPTTNHGRLLTMCQEDIPDLRRKGRKWQGRCPFHPDHEPSFYVGVHQGREYFKCFGASCGKAGGVITYQRLTGRKVKQEEYQLVTTTFMEDDVPAASPPPPEAIRDANVYFGRMLPKTRRAVEYLKGRGLNESHFEEHGLGYCPRDKGLFAHMIQRGYNQVNLIRWGLVRPRSMNAVQGGRVTIAHRTPHIPGQDLTWYTARLITSGNDRNPRYLHPAGPRPPLLSPPKPGRSILLVEGPFDMLILKIVGIRTAAVNGTPDDTYFAHALQSAGYSRIMALPDRDPGGVGWLASIAKAVESINIPFMALELPPLYADPAQLAHGPDPWGEIRQIIESAKRNRRG